MGRAGVLFLLFYLGLEFSVSRLIRAGRSIAVGGSIYIAINFVAGLGYAYLMGWPLKEVLVAAGHHDHFFQRHRRKSYFRLAAHRQSRN